MPCKNWERTLEIMFIPNRLLARCLKVYIIINIRQTLNLYFYIIYTLTFVRNISIRMFYGLERSRSFSSSRMIFSAKQSRPPLRPKNLPNWSHGKRNTLCPAPMRTSSCLRCQGLPADFDRRLPFATENLIVIETNIDDMSPQVLAFAMEELLAAGGLDVWAAPVLMKKNRSGTTLGVLCDAGHAKALTELIFRVRRSSLLDIHQ